jgi:hypothetical protein
MHVTDDEVFERFPDVLITHDNIEHYRGLLQRRLLINRCDDCGYWIYPTGRCARGAGPGR